MGFERAVKEKSRLRAAFYGPSKSGKTYTSLAIAQSLAGDKVAVIDSEKGSSRKYADRFTFDIEVLDTHHPDAYVKAVEEAALGGYEAVILDSGSHAWAGKKGILELVDAGTPSGGSSFSTGWSEVRPIESRFWDRLLSVDLHVIMTLRSKQQYVVEQVERGGRTMNVPRAIGLGPIQRDGLEYEFDLVFRMDLDHNITVVGSRYDQFKEGDLILPARQDNRPVMNEGFLIGIAEALAEGSDPVKPPAATEEAVETLRKLLQEEGRDDKRIEDVFRAERAGNKGVLDPEWVARQTQLVERRLADKRSADASTNEG